MPFKLSILTKNSSGPVHLAARGDAMATDFPQGQISHFESLLGAGWNALPVMLNMEEVAYLDSCAIGWLIESQKQFRAGGGTLVLHSVQPSVRNMLNLLKIERVVPLSADAESARQLLLTMILAGQAA